MNLMNSQSSFSLRINIFFAACLHWLSIFKEYSSLSSSKGLWFLTGMVTNPACPVIAVVLWAFFNLLVDSYVIFHRVIRAKVFFHSGANRAIVHHSLCM